MRRAARRSGVPRWARGPHSGVPIFLSAALALTAAAGLCAAPARAEMHRIALDGLFGDWETLSPVWSDPTGDGGPSGIDFGEIWIADDEEQLYLRFEVGTDLILQNDNDLTLYIDADDDPATGFPVASIGAELSWDFGSRSGFFFHGEDWTAIAWDDIGLISGPTHSGYEFEVAISRDARPSGGELLFSGSRIAIVWRDISGGGDWAPDPVDAIDYIFDQGSVEPWEVIDLERGAPGAQRLVTYNVLQDGLFIGYRQPSFARILRAIDPDVIAFQEIYNHGASQTRVLIEGWLGGSWEAVQISDKILVTRGEILASWSIAGGRAGAFLISATAGGAHDLLIINAHLSCCDNDPARQEQVDAIMAFVRDARTPGGDLDLTPDNPIVITGDMNFVGLSRQLTTLLTGDIADEGTYGPDFAPDWDESDLTDIVSRQPSNGMGYTWYKEISDYSPGRLDFHIVSDSNIESAKNLILQTTRMPSALLDAYDLDWEDTDIASDHLPYFTDLAPPGGGTVAWEPERIAAARLLLAGPNPATGGVALQLYLPDAAAGGGGCPVQLTVQNASGRIVRRLNADRIASGVAHFRWDGRDRAGRLLPANVYWIGFAAQQGGPVRRIVRVR